ncbi:MAG: hypothetical protein C4K47_06650 [Candidatus Thorarchaeota archaeon]|nr:MAG: hypothetical protein C4K47_06650 [Candidatus Thorarchaeota archaeon]
MGWKETLQIVLFFVSWLPVALLAGTTILGVTENYPQDFSIYNQQYNGLSDFRTEIEGLGYTTLSIQSTMSVISRYDGNAVLVIMGPVTYFTIDAVLTLFGHLSSGGGVLIADDFGTANSSFQLLNALIAGTYPGGSGPTNGFLSYTGGVLLDLNSYDTSPKLPVIKSANGGFRSGIDQGALTIGVNELHLNWATAINPLCLVGQLGVAWTTTRAWCETDINSENPYPDGNEWNGSLPVVGALDLGVLSTNYQGRLVATSDPSIFINDMLSRGDNRAFAGNVIQWLSYGNTSRPIVFCENLLAVPWASAEFFYGFFLGRALWLSTMPYFAPLYPIITVVGIKKYLPDVKKPEVRSVSDVFLRRGQTYFSERMTYYRTEGNYARVVKMLYKKLKRDLLERFSWPEYDVGKLWDLMRYKDSSLDEARFYKTIDRIEEISSKPGMKIKESELMTLFFWMKNISSLLVETRR